MSSFLVAAIKIWLATWFYSLLLILSGDVERNPGPEHNCSNAFPFVIGIYLFWSISAHNYAKVFLLKAYVAIHKFDIICASETYLDSSTPSDDLEVSGYILVRSDHPSNNKRGSGCIYYQSLLPLRILNVKCLQESKT